MQAEEEKHAYLFLGLLQARIGKSVISRLGQLSLHELLSLPGHELKERAGLRDEAFAAIQDLRERFDPEKLLGELEDEGVRLVTLAGAEYPGRLARTEDPPPVLFTKGSIPVATAAVAVVGSRKASASGLESARGLGRALGEAGVCVVSGLAYGIDSASHEGALEAGGPVIGVLGSGIDRVYPAKNRPLFDSVRQQGAIVSEYPPGEPPLRWRFPARNRIIAGLSEATVVVEAPEKSGSLITARHALEAGREVWAVPGPLGSPGWKGSNRLLADGAGVIWDIPEFVESIAPSSEGRRDQQEIEVEGLPFDLPTEEAGILSGVGFEPTQVDVIAERSGGEVSRVLSALSMLELKGYVARDANGAFVRVRG